MDKHLAFMESCLYYDSMNTTTTRNYTKTKFEGVYWRLSAKRDPRTGEHDRIYCSWYADHQGK